MAHPVTAATTVPVPRMDNRQARLDAAIALFRSEASASGYVVEEVRLRLPVPDVDVMPRVIIAQQSGSSGAPPPFPRSKHHRTLTSNPRHPPVQPSGSPPASAPDANYQGSPPIPSALSKPVSGEQNGEGRPPGRGGFKRTVSGSVIFHSLPAKTQRENGQLAQHGSNASQKMGPLSAIPYLPTKDENSSKQNGQPNGQFWKTVIGGERGKQILQAAESMQRLKHAGIENLSRSGKEESHTPMDISEPSTSKNSPAHSKPTSPDGGRNSQEAQSRKSKQGKKETENTHHINGHDIPESHVQLLLSSAADIQARERKSTSKSPEPVAPRQSEDKKVRLTVNTESKSNGLKSSSASNARHHTSRNRRDGSERRSSGSSAARPYKCTKCPSSFDREGHLRVHILAVHEKKRPFVCQVCDASFGHSSSLLRHVRTVHQASPAVGSGKTSNHSRHTQNSNDSGTTKSELICDDLQDDSEKHFRCSACGMAFNRVALLNRHVAEKHPLQTALPTSESKSKRSP